MTTATVYPVSAGRPAQLRWACCESTIGPACQHITAPAVRYVCKSCGAESPTGIGYVCQTSGPLPAPAIECPGLHLAAPVHRVGTVATNGARYPWRAVCTCGWQSGRGYVAEHAAAIMAADHLGEV